MASLGDAGGRSCGHPPATLLELVLRINGTMESLDCTPESKGTLYVNYTGITKIKKRVLPVTFLRHSIDDLEKEKVMLCSWLEK